MEFFNSAVDVLKTLVVALGAGLGVWGAVNLMEGYGGDHKLGHELMKAGMSMLFWMAVQVHPASCAESPPAHF